jgi:hypothetical protein
VYCGFTYEDCGSEEEMMPSNNEFESGPAQSGTPAQRERYASMRTACA